MSSNTEINTTSGKYYATVLALTSKETSEVKTPQKIVNDSPLQMLFSPLLLYGSVILFFALFLGAMVIQIVNRVADYKRTVTTLLVALMVASVPISLKTALDITIFQSRAGPDEVPRNVQLVQTGTNTLVISWETQAEKIGSVRFGKSPLDPEVSTLIIADSAKKTTRHTAEITDLKTNTEYEAEILSGKEWFNDQGKPLKFKLIP